MDSFGSAEARGFTAEAEAAGARAIVVDAKWSVENQSNAIEDLIAQNVSAVVMAPMDGVAAMSWVEKLNAANIPVVAITTQVGDAEKLGAKDVYPGVFAYVNHDDTVSGALSASVIIPLLPKDEKTQIAIVQGAPGYTVNAQRSKGFIDALDAAGANYEIVVDQPTDWSPESAQALCQNIVTSHPEVDYIYNLADPLALGCAQAVTASGSSAKVLSTTGGMAIGNAEIEAGTIVGSTCAKPETMARLGTKAALDAVTNPQAVSGKYFTYEMIAITKANLADCPPEW
jgi:ribose transport system substrate-binding protein